MLDTALLRQLYPSAPEANIVSFSQQSGAVLTEFEIANTRTRLQFFLAQLGHESGGLKIASENLSYSAKRMMEVWPKRFKTLASTNGFVHNPEALAEKVYGGRMGNDKPGDGFKYRGRGYIQITGKEDYKHVADNLGNAPNLDLIKNPDLALDPENALRIACAYWRWRKINAKCDAGDYVAVTIAINGGTIGMEDRYAWLKRVQALVAWPPAGGAPGVPPTAGEISMTRIRAAQVKLKSLGLYEGSIDGIFGKNSRKGLKVFQADNDLPKTGVLDAATLAKLQV